MELSPTVNLLKKRNFLIENTLFNILNLKKINFVNLFLIQERVKELLSSVDLIMSKLLIVILRMK